MVNGAEQPVQTRFKPGSQTVHVRFSLCSRPVHKLFTFLFTRVCVVHEVVQCLNWAVNNYEHALNKTDELHADEHVNHLRSTFVQFSFNFRPILAGYLLVPACSLLIQSRSLSVLVRSTSCSILVHEDLCYSRPCSVCEQFLNWTCEQPRCRSTYSCI